MEGILHTWTEPVGTKHLVISPDLDLPLVVSYTLASECTRTGADTSVTISDIYSFTLSGLVVQNFIAWVEVLKISYSAASFFLSRAS